MVDSSSFVRLPNGNKQLISSIGSVHLSSSFVLHNVLCVLLFQFNLLLVSKFTKAHNCFVTFYPHLCLFQDLTSGKIVGIGKENNGLYHLTKQQFQNPNFLGTVNSLSSSNTNFVALYTIRIILHVKILCL